MFQYHSAKTGRDVWIQASLTYGCEDYNGRVTGGAVDIVYVHQLPKCFIFIDHLFSLHTSNKSILSEFIEDAHAQYTTNSTSRITVHMTSKYGDWGKVVTKSRRSLSTLVLPDGVKESLLNDMMEFLEAEQWYVQAGVPHRRGM